jgi:hypothetical protein
VGTLFHVVVRLAGGNGPLRTSRYIFLYAAIPVTVVELCVKVVQMLYYGNRYFTGQTSEMFDALTVGVVLGAYVLTARLCYIGLRVLTGADRLRSILAIVTIGATVAALVATMAV